MSKKISMLLATLMVGATFMGCGAKENAPVEDQALVEENVQPEENVQLPAGNDSKLGVLAREISDKVEDMPMSMELVKDDVPAFYGEEILNLVDDFGGVMPMMQTTTEITIFKVKEGKMAEVKSILEDRKKLQEQNFEQYLPDEYEIVKNSQIYENGDYIYFISAEEKNVDTIKEMIENGIK